MKRAPQRVLLDISWEALLKVVLLAVGIYAIILLREIVVMLLVVFIFVAAANPAIVRLQRHMSRSLAVTFFYVVLLAVIALVSLLVLPTLIGQVNDLVKALPGIIKAIQPSLYAAHSSQYAQVTDQLITSAKNLAGDLSGNILATTYGFFGGLAIAVSGLVLSFYLLLEEKNAKDFFHQILPQHRFHAVYLTVSKISERMGNWVSGELLLMLIIGMSNLVIYLLLGVPTPLPLALWTAVCEVIPIVGPLLGVIPATVVSLTTYGVIKALLVFLAGFVLIQQLEAHIIVPKIMGRVVGLSPVLVIISLLIGVQLFGFVGAVVAVPTAAVVSVIVGEWSSLRKIWEEGGDEEAS